MQFHLHTLAGSKHNITYHNITFHNITYHNITYHSITYHNITYHNITYHNITYHNITYHSITYHNITYHKKKCLKKHPPGAKCYKMPEKTAPAAGGRSGALKIQKIWGLKKVAPETIFASEKRFLAAQAPTVGFGG